MTTTKAPSVPRIEVFLVAARQIATADIPADLRARIEAVAVEVNALRPSGVSIADHQPVYVDPDLFGGRQLQVGCSCGDHSKTPNLRNSTTMSWYRGHLSRVGLGRQPSEPEPVYGYGPDKGLTFTQARRRLESASR